MDFLRIRHGGAMDMAGGGREEDRHHVVEFVKYLEHAQGKHECVREEELRRTERVIYPFTNAKILDM
jgi:hypothetical protein